MVTKLGVVSSFDKVKMAPKKKARVDTDSTEANLSWTDDEVELLLGVVRAYSSQKDYEGLEWESVKSTKISEKTSSPCMNNKMDCLMISAYSHGKE